MRKIPLVKLKIRQKGRVVEVSGGAVLQNRLLSMGVYPGREITKICDSVLKGPVAVKVSRSVIALGYSMAHKIIVEIE
jgi:Fe2+ transport system protein FeoA